jgi:hypothetical protein
MVNTNTQARITECPRFLYQMYRPEKDSEAIADAAGESVEEQTYPESRRRRAGSETAKKPRMLPASEYSPRGVEP